MRRDLEPPLGLILRSRSKEQDASRIAGTDRGNLARHPPCCLFVHPSDVSPDLLIAVLSLDCFARLPLLFRHPLQVAIAVLIEAVIGEKAALDESLMLPHGDHRQVLDIEIHCHRHQIRIALALHDFAGLNPLALREVDGRACFREHQLGREGLPLGFGAPLFKIAVVAGGIVDPLPPRPCIDAQADKTLP